MPGRFVIKFSYDDDDHGGGCDTDEITHSINLIKSMTKGDGTLLVETVISLLLAGALLGTSSARLV